MFSQHNNCISSPCNCLSNYRFGRTILIILVFVSCGFAAFSRKCSYCWSFWGPCCAGLPHAAENKAAQVVENSKSQLVHLSNATDPNPEEFSPIQCKVPLSKLKQFPIHNDSKPSKYSMSQSGVVSISPRSDIVAYKKLASVPAVTRILGSTMTATSQQALDRWKQGLISALGEKGFEEFVQKQLKEGTDFHSSVSKQLLGQTVEQAVAANCDGCMKSVAHVISHISDVGIVESQVVHAQLGYRGVVDCVARYKGNPVVIEWKRSDKSKPTIKHTYDAPLQISAYIGAINYDTNYDVQLKGGLIVVAYSDGSPADVFEVPQEETERYWAKWLRRLHKYYTRL